ncbi:MAG: hypothetical protein ACOC4G_10045 [Bacillota bacterium]
MVERSSYLKKIILMGLLPLLIGTSGLISALVFTFSLIIIALFVRVVHIFIDQKLDKHSQWFLLWGTGISINNFLYILLPEIFPGLSGYLSFYYLLLGVTPLVYLDCRKKNWFELFNNFIVFSFIMILMSSAREILGQGNIFGYKILKDPVLDIFKGPAGALIMIGVFGITIEKIFEKFKFKNILEKGLLKGEKRKESLYE